MKFNLFKHKVAFQHVQIWGTAMEQSIYCLFATASAHTQQDISSKVVQQLSASAILAATQ